MLGNILIWLVIVAAAVYAYITSLPIPMAP